jgi:hypothetical protein
MLTDAQKRAKQKYNENNREYFCRKAKEHYEANKETIKARRKEKYAETKRHRLAMKEATRLALGMISTLSEPEKATLKEKVSREPEILAESLNQTLNDEILVGHVILELIRLLE